VALQETFDNDTWVLDNNGDDLFIMTNKDAPKNSIYTKLMPRTYQSIPKVISSKSTDVLRNVEMVGGQLLVSYMHDASSKAYVYNLDGSLKHQIELPGIGSISGFSGQKDSNIPPSIPSLLSPTPAWLLNMI
jgi:prolyl oligopeptidase